ncbi:hypothetical protein [Granulicella sp. L60]|uniref:hypothetical protein n=1 Tax=Granulicella sp. L60 TaxID=1641866 RepID=UPI0020B10F30|nr:hypothetical protein [Granulicella sp. L60]
MHSNPVGRTKIELFAAFAKRFASSAVGALAVVFVAVGLGGSPAHAQFDTASVLGTINDPSGAAVSSASVVLLSVTRGVAVTRQPTEAATMNFQMSSPESTRLL